MPAALDAVLAAGGGRLGEVVTTPTADGRRVTWVLCHRPGGQHRRAPGLVGRRRVTDPVEQPAAHPGRPRPRVAEVRAAVRDVAEACDAPDDVRGRPRPGRRRGGHQRHRPRLPRRDRLGRRPAERDRRRHRHHHRGHGADVRSDARSPTPDLDVPPEHRRPGGMGIHLMRLADRRDRPSTATRRRQYPDHHPAPRRTA